MCQESNVLTFTSSLPKKTDRSAYAAALEISSFSSQMFAQFAPLQDSYITFVYPGGSDLGYLGVVTWDSRLSLVVEVAGVCKNKNQRKMIRLGQHFSQRGMPPI